MAFRLPRWHRNFQLVDPKTGEPTLLGSRWQQSMAETIEAQETRQDDLLDAIIAAQAAADAADAAASAAQTAADAAQAAADNAQATADSIVVPPTGSRTVTTTQGLTADDYIILADASGGAITLTLPLASVAMNLITVTKVDPSANAVDVEPSGADNINGLAAPVSITAQYDRLTFNSDGNTDWFA